MIIWEVFFWFPTQLINGFILFLRFLKCACFCFLFNIDKNLCNCLLMPNFQWHGNSMLHDTHLKGHNNSNQYILLISRIGSQIRTYGTSDWLTLVWHFQKICEKLVSNCQLDHGIKNLFHVNSHISQYVFFCCRIR